MYIQFISFLHTEMAEIPEILHHVRQKPTLSILQLLMTWQRKEPGHQQP